MAMGSQIVVASSPFIQDVDDGRADHCAATVERAKVREGFRRHHAHGIRRI